MVTITISITRITTIISTIIGVTFIITIIDITSIISTTLLYYLLFGKGPGPGAPGLTIVSLLLLRGTPNLLLNTNTNIQSKH